MLRTPQRYWNDTFAGVPYQRGAGFRFTSILGQLVDKAVPFLQNHLLPAVAKNSFQIFMDLLDGRPLMPTIDEHVVEPLAKIMTQRGHGFSIGTMPHRKVFTQHGGSLLPAGNDSSLEVSLRRGDAIKKNKSRPLRKTRKAKASRKRKVRATKPRARKQKRVKSAKRKNHSASFKAKRALASRNQFGALLKNF